MPLTVGVGPRRTWHRPRWPAWLSTVRPSGVLMVSSRPTWPTAEAPRSGRRPAAICSCSRPADGEMQQFLHQRRKARRGGPVVPVDVDRRRDQHDPAALDRRLDNRWIARRQIALVRPAWQDSGRQQWVSAAPGRTTGSSAPGSWPAIRARMNWWNRGQQVEPADDRCRTASAAACGRRRASA